MNLQTQKLELIQWLTNLNDQKLVNQLLNLKQDSISEEDRLINESINNGLKDIKEDRTRPHSEVRKKYEKWL